MTITHRFVPAAILALGVLTTAPACATSTYGYPPYRGGPAYGSYREIERVAYDNGYREGVKAGEKDARRGRRFEPASHDDWRDADDGYRRGYGDREMYRRSFRGGFERGYAEGYRQYDRGYRRW